MSTHVEPWMEAAAKEIEVLLNATIFYELKAMDGRELRNIIARHAPVVGELVEAAKEACETGCDKCGDKRCKALLRLRAALATVEKERMA